MAAMAMSGKKYLSQKQDCPLAKNTKIIIFIMITIMLLLNLLTLINHY
jgi:cell division protein FtsL